MREATEVRPRMKQINEQLAVSVMKDCRARGVDYEGYKKELKSKVCSPPTTYPAQSPDVLLKRVARY